MGFFIEAMQNLGCGELRDYMGRDAGRIASAIASVLCYRIGYSVFNKQQKK